MPTRMALPMNQRLSDERTDALSAECTLRCHSFHLGTSGTRLRLASAVQAAEKRIGAVLGRMGKHLLAHCRINDLTHPYPR